MRSRMAKELLQLPVRLDGIRLGRCVDVVLDTADLQDGVIAVSSALLLPEDVDFYRQRGRSLSDLRSSA